MCAGMDKESMKVGKKLSASIMATSVALFVVSGLVGGCRSTTDGTVAENGKAPGCIVRDNAKDAAGTDSNQPEPLPILPSSTNDNKAEDDNKDAEKKKATKPYRLNVGDVLEISVLDEPDMTREVSIIPDGTLNYLLVGAIPAKGKTIEELREELTKALGQFFVNPYVSVLTKIINLPKEEKKTVNILGALKSPGSYQWHEGDRLLDILSSAGGLLYTQTELGTRTTANLKASYISRNGKPLDVDFYRLLQMGDMTQNVPLKPNDFIYIASAEEANVIVMGEVQNPRIIPYTRALNLVEALSICGGFTREAYRSRIVILRTEEGKSKYVEVDVDNLLHGKDVSNLTLQSGDIVYVPEQSLSEYSRYAGFLSDIAQLVLDAYSVRDAIRFPKLNRNTPSD